MSDDTEATSAKDAKRASGKLRYWIRRILLDVVIIYVAVCAGLFFLQRSIQYPRDANPVDVPPGASFAGVEDVTLEAADGVALRAWYWPGEKPTTLVIFHGNGGHRWIRRFWMKSLHDLGYGVFMLDYRGYGGSEGSPSEDGLYLDAEASVKWLEERGLDDLVYFGESLGGGVAVEMALRRKPRAIILQSPFSSAAAIAAEIYWFLPIGILMRDRYDNIDKIDSVACPMLFIHGAQDRIVPMTSGRELFEAAKEPKEWYEVTAAGHNDLTIVGGHEYLQRIDEFLKRYE